MLALLVFGQARELRALHEWASARAVAQDGRVDAAPADPGAAKQAIVADHRPAAALNVARVTDAVEDDAGARRRTTVSRESGHGVLVTRLGGGATAR